MGVCRGRLSKNRESRIEIREDARRRRGRRSPGSDASRADRDLGSLRSIGVKTEVRLASHLHARKHGRDVLEQRFLFEGANASASAISRILLTAPLVGERSVFGDRPGEESGKSDRSRTMRGFSPAPGFSFDVDLTPIDDEAFIVRFSQPRRRVPYLQGEFLWTVTDEQGGAVLDEQINTDRALEAVGEPLDGPRFSFRRWLFFRVGHRQVMANATRNIAALID